MVFDSPHKFFFYQDTIYILYVKIIYLNEILLWPEVYELRRAYIHTWNRSIRNTAHGFVALLPTIQRQ